MARVPMRSDRDAECLDDLIADARAIPASLFARTTRPPHRVIDLTIVPRQRTPIQIPVATQSFVAAAEPQLAGYCR